MVSQLVSAGRAGRPPSYCSASCRQQAYKRRLGEKGCQDALSAALARDLAEAKKLDLRRLQRRVDELEAELELERAFNRPAAQDR